VSRREPHYYVVNRDQPNVIPMRSDKPKLPYDDATLALWQQRIRDLVAANMTDREIADALLEAWSNSVQRDQLNSYLAAIRATTPYAPASKPARDPNAGPVATPEEAEEAFRQYGSDRKAAEALGISRTQLRRLRGKER
jgi:hypothetical protein